ncbi:phage protein Gp37 [Acinetobacter nectaris]|uniref:phage protein Gp37 n=1 Tax=Acinetobacter nectaris TaxID=1219382 RepID=UPI001F34C330
MQEKKWSWVREIKTYGGEFDDDITTAIRSFPAIWITFDGSGSPKRISHNKTEYPVTFVVLVGARSLRNEETRRQGTAFDIGTYQMLDHVQRLLTNNDLSITGLTGIAPLKLGRTKTIFNTAVREQSISVLAQEFTTQYVITASDRDRTEDMTTSEIHRINLDYVFQPQDDVADEHDLISLPE